MGRYYSGDINGKFWFGVQSSYAADKFGVEGNDGGHLHYHYYSDDIPTVKKALDLMHAKLGMWKKELDDFFAANDSYNDEKLKAAGFPKHRKALLELYADIHLGEKILTCLKKNGECSFEAEL